MRELPAVDFAVKEHMSQKELRILTLELACCLDVRAQAG